MIAELGGKIWGPESKELNKENIVEAHKYGLKIVTWTVNTKEEMKRVISLGSMVLLLIGRIYCVRFW